MLYTCSFLYVRLRPQGHVILHNKRLYVYIRASESVIKKFNILHLAFFCITTTSIKNVAMQATSVKVEIEITAAYKVTLKH